MSHNTVLTNKRSYVFSLDTLAKAADQWVSIRTKNASEKEETYQIVQVALPWFIKHLNQNQNRTICTFTEEYMLRELDYWKADQIVNWPHQQNRIEETCDLIVDFFHSRSVEKYKMVV